MTRTAALSAPLVRLYIITFLFFSANPIINIIVPLYSESLGASNTDIGVMMGAYLMTSMIFRPWAGKVIYRCSPLVLLRVLLITNAAILSLYGVFGQEWYVVLRAAQGVLTAFFSLVMQMGVVDTLPVNERAQGISLYLLAGMLPTTIGPLAALPLWEWGGIHAFAVTILLIGLISCLVGYNAQLPSSPAKNERDQQTDSFLGQLRMMFTHRAFLVSCIAMLTASVAYGTTTTFLALYSKQIAVGDPGYFFMIQAGTMVVFRFTLRKKVPSDGLWHAPLIIGLLLCLTVGSALLSLAAHGGAVLMYAAAMFTGFGMALLYPALATYLTFVLPKSIRNVLIGLFIAVSDLGNVLGNLVMGSVADHVSYSFMYKLCALLVFLATAVVLIGGRRLDYQMALANRGRHYP